MSRTIILSDLHVDTWTDDKVGDTGKTKQEHFFELLDWCERIEVRELIINGDLMDFPPYPQACLSPDTPSIAGDVVKRLVQFAQNCKITYIFGNHDIGVSGLRCTGHYGVPLLHNVNFAYPNYIVDNYPNSTILVEHGHLYDPMLIVYVVKLAKNLLQKRKMDAYFWGMQRRDPKDPDKVIKPGALPPVPVQPGEDFFNTVIRSNEIRGGSCWSAPVRAVKAIISRATAAPKMEDWWLSARKQMDDYVANAQEKGEQLKSLIYQVFGHTHRADAREMHNNKADVICRYLNPGTWSGGVNQGGYLDVDDEGQIWLHDWINEPPEVRLR